MAPFPKSFLSRLVLFYVFALFIPTLYEIHAQDQENTFAKNVSLIDVDSGWARNAVNAVIFRKNSLVTHEKVQYIAYYDAQQYMVIGKRNKNDNAWEVKRTPYKGNTEDAHNSISIMTDGDGFLHVAWDHHNDSLHYAKSLAPGSLSLTNKIPMTGALEDLITYPEFYKTGNGDLYFFYRYGASGNGNLVINKYDIKSKTWTQLQNNLIDGEGKRNAYWQTFVDHSGTIHVSWVWRESWDVATNHDMCYARSKDGGETWENSKSQIYDLPITLETAEIALRIPQNHELINQTSMTADKNGNPVIATYYRQDSLSFPQYFLIYKTKKNWASQAVSQRKTDFSLSGGGTKKIPISRPQILVRERKNKTQAILIFRDDERGNKPSAAINYDFPEGVWQIKDLSKEDLNSWEPTFDTELWRNESKIHLFVQKVVQEDGEGISNSSSQLIRVLEWKP